MTPRRASSLARKLARAASVERRIRPQTSISQVTLIAPKNALKGEFGTGPKMGGMNSLCRGGLCLIRDLRVELRGGHTDERTRLFDPGDRRLQVVVVLERFLDQALQYRIAKYSPPRQIGERRGLGGPQHPAELFGGGYGRSLVVRPHSMQHLVAERCAARQQRGPKDESAESRVLFISVLRRARGASWAAGGAWAARPVKTAVPPPMGVPLGNGGRGARPARRAGTRKMRTQSRRSCRRRERAVRRRASARRRSQSIAAAGRK